MEALGSPSDPLPLPLTGNSLIFSLGFFFPHGLFKVRALFIFLIVCIVSGFSFCNKLKASFVEIGIRMMLVVVYFIIDM